MSRSQALLATACCAVAMGVIGAGLGATTIAVRPPSPSAASRAHDTPSVEPPTGGGPDGGTVFRLATVATHPTTVFATMGSGGVFKSSDQSVTRTSAGLGLQQEVACELVADPSRPRTLYAVCENGLFKTTNLGARWRQLDVDHPVLPAIAPSDPRVLYEPSLPSFVRSADGGQHWERVDEPAPNCFLGVVVDPGDPFRLYCATGASVQLSRDGGRTWIALGETKPELDMVRGLRRFRALASVGPAA